LKLEKIAERLLADLTGDGETEILNIAHPDEAGPSDLVYVEKQEFLELAKTSRAGAFLLDNRICLEDPRPQIKTAHAQLAFIKTLQLFDSANQHQPVSSPSIQGDNCQIAPSAKVMANCVLGSGVIIEADVVIHPLCSLGDNVRLGKGSVLYSNVVVGRNCEIGENCILFPGAVIGSDGFGYHDENGERYRYPHLGRVVLGDKVEVGANSTIDRGVLGSTVIGTGTKIDNLVHIAHNCRIGSNCYLVAQSGVAGSTTLGNGVTIAGQSGVSDHLKIGNQVIVVGKSAVRTSLGDGEIVGGIPALPIRLQTEIMETMPSLPKLVKRFEDLETTGQEEITTDQGAPGDDWQEAVISILSEHLRVEAEELRPDIDLKEEFGADSLTVLSIVTDIEAHFDIGIPDEDVRNLKTPREIVRYVGEQL
jgi:UDP-3-O-[3-hydroxymyristoyl] glucosamine N-acyltransferase